MLGSLLCFVVIVSTFGVTTREEGGEYLEELSEIILLVVWALFQTLRVIFIAKRQRLAQQSAKTLINFTNNAIAIDTNAGHNESDNTDRPR